ncbi:hypothetical protein JR316_0009388 [Psilocybe cubensis]|uniref:HNH nuclease domain-containing protein n=2 Tax=Psilocybe cubensis TaxID=181762 RepID=A0A8H8CJA1_PSICU|nr:hypothetical protein JR316_0009388 [Psilocybe cubensis]KAH9478925.1 hypothetical protein JR316_0009388 [Psilocybe cubensis]
MIFSPANGLFNPFKSKYNVPEDIAKSVLKREQGRCIITGCADPDALTVAWLIPPLFVKHLYHVRGNREYTRYSEITKPGNAITLRKDLEDAFLDGAFGIDVDEDYRLVMFRDIGPAGHTLKGLNVKAYFRSPDVEAQRTGPEDIFLRAQLVNCIYVNFHGGDINAQWTPGMIREKEDELGLSPRSDFRRPRKNKRWEDELAQIVHELHYGRPFGDHDDNSDTEYDSEVYSDSERGGGGRNEGDSSSNESNLDK